MDKTLVSILSSGCFALAIGFLSVPVAEVMVAVKQKPPPVIHEIKHEKPGWEPEFSEPKPGKVLLDFPPESPDF